MKLSELKFGFVLKDVDFNFLGLTAEEYKGKKVLTFLNNIKYLKEIEQNKTIVGIITTEEIAKELLNTNYGILVVDNPKKKFFLIHNKLTQEEFYLKKVENKISSKAIISEKTNFGKNNIVIEDDVIIEDNVTI